MVLILADPAHVVETSDLNVEKCACWWVQKTRLFSRDALFAVAWPDFIEGRECVINGPLPNVMTTVPLPSAFEVDSVAVLVFEIFTYFVGMVCLQLYKVLAHQLPLHSHGELQRHSRLSPNALAWRSLIKSPKLSCDHRCERASCSNRS